MKEYFDNTRISGIHFSNNYNNKVQDDFNAKKYRLMLVFVLWLSHI